MWNQATDDLGLSPEFLCDEDIARDEDNYGRERRCTCGRDAAYEEFYRYSYPGDQFPHDAFAGCRGCDPVDHECKPYGFGIERWEDAALMRCQHASRGLNEIGLLNDGTYAALLEAARTIYSARRQKHSKIVWDRICCEVETHREAVAKYKAWAKRAVTVRYRDCK